MKVKMQRFVFHPTPKSRFFLGMLVVSSSLCKSQSASPIANLSQSCKIKEKQLQSKQLWGFIFPFFIFLSCISERKERNGSSTVSMDIKTPKSLCFESIPYPISQ